MAYRPKEDYLKFAEPSIPSFHFRTGKTPLLSGDFGPNVKFSRANVPSLSQPTNQFGFPHPGTQSPTPAEATAKHYFADERTWADIVDHGDFDDIVVGSGFCALAYVDAALKKDPMRKILVLERGGFWLTEHFQNMPLPFKLVLGGPSETFPFQLSSNTVRSPAKFMHGSCPFFGGRSLFWSAWCPRAIREDKGIDLMREFPASMKETASKPGFWERCEDFLHVARANEITDPRFGQGLQKAIQDQLDEHLGDIPSASMTNPAPLAIGRKTSVPGTLVFDKYSTPGPLLTIYERQRKLAKEGKGHPLTIATDTIVERFELDPEDPYNRPIMLHTSRGVLCFPKGRTNIILAAGVFPATTILMNSIGDRLQGRAGSRVSGHYISHITARFPITMDWKEHLEIAASYLAGKDSKSGLQYHIQITAIHSPNPEEDAEDAARLCPDYAAAATAEQLEGSEGHVVLVCATLGELDEKNGQSWVRHEPANPDVTTNIRLQVLPNANTDSCTEVMEDATYKAIAIMAGDAAGELEYWHDAETSVVHGEFAVADPGWKKERPPTEMVRVPGLVHETSTLYMSDDLEGDTKASVDSLYRPYKCDNVYVTGGALFPTSGSWNPTLAMCGFAQDLADKLHQRKKWGGNVPIAIPPQIPQ